MNFGGLEDENAAPCLDLDECAENEDACNRGMKCVNTPGSYNCPECLPGWEPLDSTTCQDINECYAGTHACADPGKAFSNFLDKQKKLRKM